MVGESGACWYGGACWYRVFSQKLFISQDSSKHGFIIIWYQHFLSYTIIWKATYTKVIAFLRFVGVESKFWCQTKTLAFFYQKASLPMSIF